MNILIIDDREENLYLLEALLTGNGYGVQRAANGNEALEILHTGGIDLIVSDILMPVMDGFQLCRKVKADPSLRHIPIIIYSGTYTSPKDEELALKIGVNRFLQKPCEPEVFIQAVKEVMAAMPATESPPAETAAPEEEVLQLYNERLVHKLEQKMAEAEQEIAARREAEKALRESEQKYRQITENISDVVWLANLNMQTTYVSPSVERLVGEPIEVHRQRTMEEKFPPDSLQVLYEALVEEMENEKDPACDKKRSRLIEVQHYRADGSPIWVSINISFVRDENGTPIGFQGVTRDITDHKLAEQEREKLQTQLIQAQKMEAVGRLAGGVAHDFNNMLGVILGYAEMAQNKVSPEDPLHLDLNEIINAARRSADITRQLLAFARQQTAAPKVVDLNETVEQMLRMLRRLIGEDIDLQWWPRGKLWSVKIDPSQMNQILANLCVNARDAIAGVGKITIRTDNVRFGRDQCLGHPDRVPGDYVMLAVSDNGCGMDAETRNHLFEPFFTTKEVGQGTGLGLATIYGIVRQNDGFIDVCSEPGKGTTFKLYFPRDTAAAEAEDEPPAVEIPLGNGETLLMVEDEAAILKLGQTMLESLGYQVLVATDPTEAIALAKAHAEKIRLLITDVVMPKINGQALAAQLQAQSPGLKTLFMSGYTADVIAHRGVLDEEMQFIQKPFSREELALKVREVLG